MLCLVVNSVNQFLPQYGHLAVLWQPTLKSLFSEAIRMLLKKSTQAATQLKRLVSGFPPRRPGFEPGSDQVGFVVDKVALGRVFSEYFGFPCQSSFHQILHLKITRGRYNRPISGRRAHWTQFGSNLHYANLKKYILRSALASSSKYGRGLKFHFHYKSALITLERSIFFLVLIIYYF
jgi:hypothetical protein